MTDSERIERLILEVKQQLEILGAEVHALIEASSGADTVNRALRASISSGTESATNELPNVILPTQTDDPESIVGGHSTSEYPECCAVGNERGYFCTGTLIAPSLVVTAKHCMDITRVFIGGSDTAYPDDGETIRVGRTIPHPDPMVDLQILLLEQDSQISPVHVAQQHEVPKQSSRPNARLVGFGTIDLSGRVGYGIKRMVDVPITAIEYTSSAAQRWGCRQGEMVAGHRGLNRDSCHGDSGGPLYIEGSEGGFFLLGATSRGARGATNACGDGGIYVRVDQYLDWIRQAADIDIEGPIT